MSTDFDPDTNTYLIAGVEDESSREHDCPEHNGARVVVPGSVVDGFTCPFCGQAA